MVNRRIIVLGGLAASGALFGSAGRARAALPSYPFKLGVASGDPTSDGMVLWTRLAPSPLNADGQGGMPNRDVRVEWQLARDEAFTQVVASGAVTARYAAAHSVHVEPAGLQSGAEYFYRFRAEGHISPVGRTRTTPAPGAGGGQLTIAFASCANYQEGYFTVYRRMAEDNPGLMLHLGDYIYEGGPTSGLPRQHATGEIRELATYRARYGQYKSDPDLQAAHAAAPWLVVWDDHEVENNYAGLQHDEDHEQTRPFSERRADAYRAFYENMPLRASAAPSGPAMQLYRRVRWGQLATFHMLDTRQYRSNQACGDGRQKGCTEAALASRSITGGGQETWLLDGLAQHFGTWDIIGQQVFFAQKLYDDGTTSMDAWDGYLASRNRIQRGWVDRAVRNPVVLTGDVHRAWANDLKLDYTSATAPVIGTELVCTSVTSGGDNPEALTAAARTLYADEEVVPYTATMAASNPHLKFYSALRGYVRATMDASTLRADFRAVDRVSVRDHPARTLASFVVEDGRPGLEAL